MLSANNFAVDIKLSGRSFMYIKNSKGPKIEPWGTPDLIGDQLEDCPLSKTRWYLLFKKLSSNFSN